MALVVFDKKGPESLSQKMQQRWFERQHGVQWWDVKAARGKSFMTVLAALDRRNQRIHIQTDMPKMEQETAGSSFLEGGHGSSLGKDLGVCIGLFDGRDQRLYLGRQTRYGIKDSMEISSIIRMWKQLGRSPWRATVCI